MRNGILKKKLHEFFYYCVISSTFSIKLATHKFIRL